VNDDIGPLRSLSLVTGDGITPDGLDQVPHVAPVATGTLGVKRDVVVVVTLVKAVPSRDRRTIFRRYGSAEGQAVDVLHVVQRHEHAVDQTQIVPVLEADDLLTVALRVNAVEARGLLHGLVEM